MAKSIATINTTLPSVGERISYTSGDSLRDYDIVLFAPQFPYLSRIEFSGGGSCISIEASQEIQSAMQHWSAELSEALKAGKTVFFILNEKEIDSAASGSSLGPKQRTYHTSQINNYEALPLKLSVRNTKGKHIIVTDSAFRSLYEALKEVAQYKVILESQIGEKIYTAKDGSVVGAVVSLKDIPGKLVLLPHFDLDEYDAAHENKWSSKALQISKGIVSQLVAVDAYLQRGADGTPAPPWVEKISQPKRVIEFEKSIVILEQKIEALSADKAKELAAKEDLLKFSHLLYENGKKLEAAIEESLRLLGYRVENYRAGDLEIDHIITSPSGLRMIGESEGKDNSAIDISKFRQLESNINEDFEREEVASPAKGILFGNGFRFACPAERPDQFTAKCLTNAKRLRTALIRTADLYRVVVHLLDHPEDDAFKEACRQSIESTEGEVVNFPQPS